VAEVPVKWRLYDIVGLEAEAKVKCIFIWHVKKVEAFALLNSNTT